MAQKPQEKQRMFDIGAEEMWTPFLEEVNDLMIEEKQARHETDAIKTSEICVRIVSQLNHIRHSKLNQILKLVDFTYPT